MACLGFWRLCAWSLLLAFLSIDAIAMNTDFSKVVTQVEGAVVSIQSHRSSEHQKKLLPDHLRAELEQTPLMDVLREMFGNDLDTTLQGSAPGIGAGTIITASGYIVTNYHVIKGAEKIVIKTSDKRQFEAKVIGFDLGTDLAVLKIDTKKALPYIEFAPKADVRIGEWVMAMGSPFGFEHSVTVGVVSAKHRSLGEERYVPFIQTDVAINPGNSGGPLINTQGELIGVNSQIVSESGSYEGLSFAVPAKVAAMVVDNIINQGSVSRGWMGLGFQEVTRDLAASFGLKHVKGALVAKVMRGSPAAIAGLKVGDVILKINNQTIVHATDLPPIVGLIPVNSALKLQIIRDKQQKAMTLTLGASGAVVVSEPEYQLKVIPKVDGYGIKVRDLKIEETGSNRKVFGVVVTNVQAKYWRKIGLRNGDIIISLNQQFVSSTKNFYKMLSNAPKGKAISVLVVHPGQMQRYYAVRLGN